MGEVASFDHAPKMLKLVLNRTGDNIAWSSESEQAATTTTTTTRIGNSITVSDDTCNPEAKFHFHPDGLWFGHRKVVDAVVETSYKTYFKGPYYNWGVTPAEVKDRWWNAFKGLYRLGAGQWLVGGLAGRGWGWWLGGLGQGGCTGGVLGARGCPTGGLGSWWLGGLTGVGGGWQGQWLVAGWAGRGWSRGLDRSVLGAVAGGCTGGLMLTSLGLIIHQIYIATQGKEITRFSFIGEVGMAVKCARYLSGIASKVCIDPSYKATWCAPALRAHKKKSDKKMKISKGDKANVPKTGCRMKVKGFTIVKLINPIALMYACLREELARLPTAPELYYDGHVDNDGQFVNPKAEQVWDEFQKKKAANSNVVGGWNEKGRIFGLGATAHSYYDRPTCEERMVRSHGESTLRVWRHKLLNLLQKMTINRKN
ncbi:hypothetical protein RDABS01_020021 [Bienertia sinuspersici]